MNTVKHELHLDNKIEIDYKCNQLIKNNDSIMQSLIVIFLIVNVQFNYISVRLNYLCNLMI